MKIMDFHGAELWHKINKFKFILSKAKQNLRKYFKGNSVNSSVMFWVQNLSCCEKQK